jgi:hypothetical protein
MQHSSPSGRGRKPATGGRFLRWLETQTAREDEIGRLARDVGSDAARHGLSDVDYLSHLGSGKIDAPEARLTLFEAMTVWAQAEQADRDGPVFHPGGRGRSRTCSDRP